MTTTEVQHCAPDVNRPGRSVAWISGIVILGLVLLRGILSARGYLVGDDFAVRFRAASQPWSLAYAFDPYNDHISPIGYSLQWVLQAVFPGSHVALVVTTSLLMALALGLTAVVLWHVTQRLLGVLIGLVTMGFGLFTFEVGTWWCTSLYSVTYLMFAMLALCGLVMLLRFDRGWWLLIAGFVGAVLSDSKGFTLLLLLFGVAAGIAVTASGALGIRLAWRRLRAFWLGAAALSCAAVVLSALNTSGVQGQPTVGKALGMLRDLWVVNISPAVFGGPWAWWPVPTQTWPAVRVLPDTPELIGWLCLALVIAGLVFIVRRRPAIRAFVPWAVAYALLSTLIPVIARSGTTVASPAYRYTYDVVIPLVLLLVLATVGLWWQRRNVRWATALVVALTASMAVSTVVPAVSWGHNEAKQYVRRAVEGFAQIPPGQAVMPQRVPEDLVPGLLWQYANTEAVLSPQPGAPDFATTVYAALYGFASDGSLQRQDVLGPTSVEGPDKDCGYAVTDAPRSIPLDAEVIAWPFLARVAYFSAEDTTLNLAIGGQIHTVDLPASELTAVYLPVMGPGRDVLVSVGTPGVTACVTELRIGNRVVAGTDELVPAPPGDPGS